jgi:hypothetical protein
MSPDYGSPPAKNAEMSREIIKLAVVSLFILLSPRHHPRYLIRLELKAVTYLEMWDLGEGIALKSTHSSTACGR